MTTETTTTTATAATHEFAPNPLLAVLQILDPGHAWPDTLDPTAVGLLSQHAAHLVRLARDIAEHAEQEATPCGAPAPPQQRADVLLVEWAAFAGRHAAQLLRTAGLTGRTDAEPAEENGPLIAAVTAALTWRDAQFHHGPGGPGGPGEYRTRQRHRRSVLNRALWAADWINQSWLTEPITGTTAAHVFANHLSPGWRWEHRPAGHSAEGLYRGELRQLWFSVTHQLPAGYERITVTGTGNETVEIVHEGRSRSDATTMLTWAEMCQLIARSEVRPTTTAT